MGLRMQGNLYFWTCLSRWQLVKSAPRGKISQDGNISAIGQDKSQKTSGDH